MQTWYDFDHITYAAIDQWRDYLRSCVHAGSGHFEHMFIYDSAECFMKLSM